MATFKERIEDLAGTIPATCDAEQFIKDGAHDVIHKVLTYAPHHADSFTGSSVSISDGGTAVDGHIQSVEIHGSEAREISLKERLAAQDTNSIYAATTEDPVYWKTQGVIIPYPSGGCATAFVAEHGAISNWDSSNSAIANFPEDFYYQVILYASMKVLHHRMVVHTMPTLGTINTMVGINAPTMPSLETTSLSFHASPPTYTEPTITSTAGSPDDLTDMLDSDWTSADYDFDDENIDFATWFQLAGDMIQNQEDVELASMQLQKIASYVNAYTTSMQNRLNKFNDENVEYQAKLQEAIQNANLSDSADSKKITKFQSEIQKYQQEVNTVATENGTTLSKFQAEIQQKSGEYQWMQGQLSALKQQYDESWLPLAQKGEE